MKDKHYLLIILGLLLVSGIVVIVLHKKAIAAPSTPTATIPGNVGTIGGTAQQITPGQVATPSAPATNVVYQFATDTASKLSNLDLAVIKAMPITQQQDIKFNTGIRF